MILYLDASALVKRYVLESGSREVVSLIGDAAAAATSAVSRAEIAAAFARSVRLGVLGENDGRRIQRRFTAEWPDLIRIPVTEALVARAESLAWAYRLRGYDAVQLASALAWQDSIGQDVVFAAFDRQLRKAASETGVQVWPLP